ncbi:hypothetical protein [Streptomyces hundungensis]|uniref:hypothetical protein n=1 Tax=Streptomyces hundungensis TaxID=1077946 RepID=UPI0031EF2628
MDNIEEFLKTKGPFMAGGPVVEVVLRRWREAVEAGDITAGVILERLMVDIGRLLGDQGDPDWKPEWEQS